jgi:glycerophosphoryl diester phosphodiesterase
MIPRDGERIPQLAEVIERVRFAPKPFWLFVELKASLADPALSAAPEELADATVAVIEQAGYIERSVLIGFDWRGLVRAQARQPSLARWFSTRPQSWFEDDDPPAADDPPPRPALDMLRHWGRTATSPWAAGFDAIRYGGSIVAAIKAAGGEGWFPYWRDATAQSVAEAHALGLKVGAWTVDDPGKMRALAHIGVDAICTDRPDLISPVG